MSAIVSARGGILTVPNTITIGALAGLAVASRRRKWSRLASGRRLHDGTSPCARQPSDRARSWRASGAAVAVDAGQPGSSRLRPECRPARVEIHTVQSGYTTPQVASPLLQAKR